MSSIPEYFIIPDELISDVMRQATENSMIFSHLIAGGLPPTGNRDYDVFKFRERNILKRFIRWFKTIRRPKVYQIDWTKTTYRI